eukprot:80333-Chlamydomonas_euryale.AAC.8
MGRALGGLDHGQNEMHANANGAHVWEVQQEVGPSSHGRWVSTNPDSTDLSSPCEATVTADAAVVNISPICQRSGDLQPRRIQPADAAHIS